MHMQQSYLVSQAIRSIQIYYYASTHHIFINTILLQLIHDKYLPSNINISKTQLTQPQHHIYGETPFLCINHRHIVKKQQLSDFMTLTLNIDPSRKYQFLSIIKLCSQISQVSNLFSQQDQNPYWIFISPWKKYKQHKYLQDKKHWYRQNTLFYTNNDDTLNKEYFIYRINLLASLVQEYSKEHVTRIEYLRIYKVIVYGLIKHLKSVQKVLYDCAVQKDVLKQLQIQVQKSISIDNQQRLNNEVPFERPAVRLIPFTNVHINDLKQNQQEMKKPQQEEVNYQTQRQKKNQIIFKPIFATVLFALAMWSFK